MLLYIHITVLSLFSLIAVIAAREGCHLAQALHSKMAMHKEGIDPRTSERICPY